VTRNQTKQRRERVPGRASGPARCAGGPRPPRRVGATLLALAAVAAVTFAAYTGAFDHAFVSWDDPDYVEENTLVQQHDTHSLLTAVISNNYHPLTMVSLAMNASQPLSPKPFIVTNVILHTINTGLVFWLTLLLSGRRVLVASIAALLFGIHPMHVESVAWISERKDVLYCFFFLSACITYWRYLERRAWPWLLATFVLFVLSCLSKGMAVVFPVVMVLLDFWKRRPVFETKSLLEKVPFLAVALLFGMIAMNVQAGGDFHGAFTRVDKGLKGLADTLPVSPLQRLTLPCYGYLMYAWKLFVPLNLSGFYPYPSPSEANGILFLLSPLFLLGTVALAVWDARRTRLATFGIGWFFVTIAPVLQWVPVGEAIMADRYSYLSYVGPIFALTYGIALALRKAPALRPVAWAACGLYAAFFFLQTTRQVETWRDSETFWSSVIRRFPRSDLAYISRGNFRGKSGRVPEAMADLQTALRLGSRRGILFDGLGNAYGTLGQVDSALIMFDRGLSLEPNMGRTYYNRAIAYLRLARPNEALADLERARVLMPLQAATLYFPRGNAYMQLTRYREAIGEFDRAIEAGVRDPYAYYNRGVCKSRVGDSDGAAADFREAHRLNPALGSAAAPG
jgi:protein O-mannosyl-transferase